MYFANGSIELLSAVMHSCTASQGEDRIVKHTFKSFVAATKEAKRLAERKRRRQERQQQQDGGKRSKEADVSVPTLSSEVPQGHHFEVPSEWKRPVLPTIEEVATNPRSRSAKLRVLQRCSNDSCHGEIRTES